MDYAEREALGYRNGVVWQSPTFLRIVLTWAGSDQWILMGEPTAGRDGGFVMVPHTDASGRWLWNGDELPARLEGWRYLAGVSLRPLADFETLSADAARYRLLRDADGSDFYGAVQDATGQYPNEHVGAEELLDAEIAKQAKGE